MTRIEHHTIIYRSNDGKLYSAETEYPLSFKRAAELIRSGEFEHVVQVIESIPSENWSRDVSEDVALEVAALARDEGELSRPGLEFIDLCDAEVGNQVRWLEAV